MGLRRTKSEQIVNLLIRGSLLQDHDDGIAVNLDVDRIFALDVLQQVNFFGREFEMEELGPRLKT